MTDLARTTIRRSFPSIIAPQSAQPPSPTPDLWRQSPYILGVKLVYAGRLNVPVPSEFMPAPRLLVMEGNSPETRAQHVAAGGTVASKGYAELLHELLPNAVVDVCFPGDPGANLPNGEALEGYDGVAITGSGLHVYDGGPAVTRQIELVRAMLEAGTPV